MAKISQSFCSLPLLCLSTISTTTVSSSRPLVKKSYQNFWLRLTGPPGHLSCLQTWRRGALGKRSACCCVGSSLARTLGTVWHIWTSLSTVGICISLRPLDNCIFQHYIEANSTRYLNVMSSKEKSFAHRVWFTRRVVFQHDHRRHEHHDHLHHDHHPHDHHHHDHHENLDKGASPVMLSSKCQRGSQR